MTEERAKELQKLCLQFRNEIVDLLHDIQTGHPGGSLSCTEIVTTLYYEKMNIDPKNPNMEGRDHFILSKGHAAPILYIVLAELGFFPKEELKTLRQINSILQGHPCVHKTPGVELSTGPLGLGLGAGLGMMLSDKLQGRDNYTYVVLGDGEIEEGAIWEAAMAASHYKLDNLTFMLDHNGLQIDGSNDQVMGLGDIVKKFEAFGFECFKADGHDIDAIVKALKTPVHGKPKFICCETIKGKGVSFMENEFGWHGSPMNKEQFEKALKEQEV